MTIADSLDYPAMHIRLDDLPPRLLPPTVVQAPIVAPSVEPKANVKAKEKPTIHEASGTNVTAIGVSPTAVGASSESTAVAPLHGPLRRAGLSIVYVLDRSGSMGQSDKLIHAIALLKSSLRQLGPDVRFQLVTYDRRAAIARLAGGLDLVLASQSNIVEAEHLLDELVGEGSSRHADGLRTGLALHPDLLILVSDAGDLSPSEVRQIKRSNQSGAAIHAVLLGARDDDGVVALRDLTGPGRIHFVSVPAPPLLGP